MTWKGNVIKVKQFRSSGGTSTVYVFSLFLNTDSDEADVTSLGMTFHTFALATGKARPPMVDDDRLERQAVQWRRT